MHVSSGSRVRSLRWLFLLLLALVAFTTLAAEPREVGRVLVASGEVTATREGASTRALSRGDRLYEGDAITTGAGARVQLRLVDEGLVQLSADTEYRIEHYRTQGEERGAVTELVEGGLRTVTGAIGDDDPEDYQLDTPVATIGIRGTHFALHHSGDDGTVGEVAQGAIVVENDGGAAEIGAGQFFTVRSRDQAPQEQEQRPEQLESRNEQGGDADDEEGEEDGEDDGEAANDDGEDEEGETVDGEEGQGENDGDGATEDRADPAPEEGTTDGDEGLSAGDDDPVYNPGEDEETRREVEEEAEEDTEDEPVEDEPVEDEPVEDEPVEDEPVEDEPTPWYEDDSLTQFGVTGFLGTESFPGWAVDGEEYPDNEELVYRAEVDGEGMLTEMVYFNVYESEEYEEIRMVAMEGAEPTSTGSHDELGIHWGRWNLGDYEKLVNGNIMISPDKEEGPPPGTDWHWLVLEDAEDLTTPEQFSALEGTEVDFQWAGGTEIRATDSGGENVFDFSVETFDLTADFNANEFTAGELTVTHAGDGEPPRELITLDSVGESGMNDGRFEVNMFSSEEDAAGFIMGNFVGEDADGAGVTFTINDFETGMQGLEGVGALEKQ